jgi:sn-glycerol 3-phosphate transport system substrate-binding protein
MIKRRPFAAITALTLTASLILAGCGGSKPAAETPAAPVAEEKLEPLNGEEIEFWFAIGGKGQEWVKAAAEKFNASQTEVKVTPVYQGDYYTNHQKLSTAIAAGTPPAMTMIEVASLAFFSDNGALSDINALAGKDNAWIGDFHEGLMKEAKWNGKLTSIPFNRSTPILYLNVNALKEAGLDPKGPKNWDELRDYAKKLTVVKDGKVERWGFLTPVDIWFYEAMVQQAGGSILSADGKKATVNEQPGQDALQFWVDLIHADKVMEMPQGEKYNAWDVTTKALTGGQAAMIYSTTGRLLSHVNGAKANGIEVATSFLPAGKAGYGTPTGGANVAVLASAPKNKQRAAMKFIQWLSSPENAADFSKTTGYVPVNKAGTAAMADTIKAVPQYQAAIDQLQYAVPRPQHPAYAEMQEQIMKALQMAVLKEKPVKDALDEAAALTTKSLK